MSGHTAGPWDSHGEDEVMAGDWDKHVATAWNNDKIEPDEATANARLIASAPDLLAACVKALNVMTMCGTHAGDDAEAAVREAKWALWDAIRKANGGTP